MPASTPQKTFLILDGNALLHRAWHSIPQTMATSDGTVVNAAYGFTNIIERLLETRKPDYMAVAWDLPGGTFRHEEFAEYKATREKKAQELYDQIPIIQDILSCYGIPSLSQKGFEADDILGTLAKLGTKKKLTTLIVTGDMDSLQLVDDHVSVLFFIKGISETKTYTPDAVRERFGFDPEQLIDYKALMGDPSDNIKGVSGIGEKSAKELIAEYGSIEGIFKALKKNPEGFKPAWRSKLEGQEEHALKMKRLVTIVCDVPLDNFSWDDAKIKKLETEKLIEVFRNLEFKTLLKKYDKTHVGSESISPSSRLPAGALEKVGGGGRGGERKLATSAKLEDLTTNELSIAIETQAEDLFGGTIRSITLYDGEKLCVNDHPTSEDIQKIINKLSEAKSLIGHDLKAMMHAIKWRASIPSLFDTLIASSLLNPAGRELDFPILVQRLLGKSLPANPSATESVVHLPALREKMTKEITKENMSKVMEEIEMPLVPVLYDMESTGVKLDTEFLKKLSKKMTGELDELTKKIHDSAGKSFNINSPSQLADILFDHLKIPTKGIKRTKTGWSTSVDELEKIVELHPMISLVMEYRELAKLVSTYVDSLPELVGKDGRLHTTYKQIGAATGRMASTNPNLQNIPIRTEQGRAIRKAFVAADGKMLIAADYSQIELRLAAIIAQDKPFIEAFKEGADIHTRTAAEVWSVDEDKVTPEQRRAAKAVNFGILYGMGPRNLAKSTGLSLEEAKEFIDRYFSIHHAIADYIDQTKLKAHNEGVVETLFGRKRYFPEINSGIPMMIAQAERMAINMPVQGTEADIVKMAMVSVDAWLKEKKIPASQILQVHDELVLEVDEQQAEEVGRELKSVMERVVKLDVPLVAEVAIGKNWDEMKDVN